MKLRFTSCQAPNAEDLASQIAGYLGRRVGIEIEVVSGGDWHAREKALFSGEIQIGWICGLPYVLEKQKPAPSIGSLAAQVMSGDRYQQKPVYFSDVVVLTNSPFWEFKDLRGAIWAYNEPHSHSGYNITCYMLAQKGFGGEFFNERIQAGSHERSLRLLLRGKIDATALDSTVLEAELRNNPSLEKQIRVIESWGPSPIPPWVIQHSLDKNLAARLRDAITQMDLSNEGRAVLAKGGVSRFVPVTDNDYDSIKDMYRIGSEIEL